MNCKDMCTTLKCGGHLRRITHDSLLKDNHYAKLYQSSLMQPLHIKEHTAQLGREEQQKYQEMFVNKEINALSCSTTFEMGVDVGDLETVYLRNMPPSPANYVQRAGRAGRGKNAAAFSLTYAKLSSHDFTSVSYTHLDVYKRQIYDSEESLHRNVLLFYGGAEISANQVKRDHYTLVVPKMSEVKTENTDIVEIDSMKNAGLKAFFLDLKDGYVLSVDGRLIAFDSENGTDLKVITPNESTSLPTVTIQDTEAFLAFRKSTCRIILGNRDYTQQFVLLKDGERIEFDSLEQSDNGLAFTMPFDGEHDTVRIQVINLANERLMFDRTFVLISEADCCFNREFYYNASDYDGAEFYADIDDFHEVVPFGKDEAEVRIPFRDGELHADIPKITVSETSGAWLQEPQPAWYIGHIPQNSFLKVTTPAMVNVQFLVGGKDILYDGQGLVTIGNVLQSFGGTAVSYTHLDVYKRQGHHHAFITYRRL